MVEQAGSVIVSLLLFSSFSFIANPHTHFLSPSLTHGISLRGFPSVYALVRMALIVAKGSA